MPQIVPDVIASPLIRPAATFSPLRGAKDLARKPTKRGWQTDCFFTW